MNHWDPHMNDPFLNASNQGDKAERMDNNAPPVAPLPTAPAAMPTAYYSPVTPYGYWCPPAVPMAPLVSPAHLDSPDEFDSPDSSDMMPPAPPLGLGAVPNVAPTFAWPVGGKKMHRRCPMTVALLHTIWQLRMKGWELLLPV